MLTKGKKKPTEKKARVLDAMALLTMHRDRVTKSWVCLSPGTAYNLRDRKSLPTGGVGAGSRREPRLRS